MAFAAVQLLLADVGELLCAWLGQGLLVPAPRENI